MPYFEVLFYVKFILNFVPEVLVRKESFVLYSQSSTTMAYAAVLGED
jgi:hypothetical protein